MHRNHTLDMLPVELRNVSQRSREILRTETGAADIQQHEHAALGRERPTIRGVGEYARQQKGAVPISLAQGSDFGELAAECGHGSVLDEGGAAEIHAQQEIE